MTEHDVNRLISSAYSRDLDKPELSAFKELVRTSRKYGYPIISTVTNQSLEEQISWAAKLLLNVSNSYPSNELPSTIKPNRG